MEYILLMIGFIFLIKGADLFVEGSCNLARFLKVPSVIIGLTIVAMGTSAPEASVSIRAAFTGNNEIALSNIIGSNIFNIFNFFKLNYNLSNHIFLNDSPINKNFNS